MKGHTAGKWQMLNPCLLSLREDWTGPPVVISLLSNSEVHVGIQRDTEEAQKDPSRGHQIPKLIILGPAHPTVVLFSKHNV